MSKKRPALGVVRDELTWQVQHQRDYGSVVVDETVSSYLSGDAALFVVDKCFAALWSYYVGTRYVCIGPAGPLNSAPSRGLARRVHSCPPLQ
jgi:hypothetical protein